MKRLQIVILFLITGISSWATEYHVAKSGNNSNSGNRDTPLLSIQAAANLAQPGDIITVHAGIYREWLKPPRGGTSNNKRIVYRAASGEKVEIKGSEIIKNWKPFVGDVWKVVIPNSFFGDYNPYINKIHGDWFNDMGRIHHTGDVYLNGKSMWEMAILENILNPIPQNDNLDHKGSTYTWYCEYDDKNTYIYANFQGNNPNKETVEINVRKSCFYPGQTGINYITVRGFILRHAATQWAPPTAEQIGLVGTNWSKGWIIENNTISDSRCSGITLGKYGDEFDNTSENSAEGYVETIKRAYKKGWNKENIGHHIIRNNIICNCEQTGICGSLGGIFSTIENNTIYNIWKKRQFTGAEMGGIKIHASIDMVIKNNRIAFCGRGLWLDWMAQGTRVTGNLFYNNTTDDIFVEVNHGPFLIENNIFLSGLSVRDWSEGGAFVHNLIAGNIELRPQSRYTPYLLCHSTEIAGLKQTKGGDQRYYNNIFVGGTEEIQGRKSGLGVYENTELQMFVNGNIYLNGARTFKNEEKQLVLNYNPDIQIREKNDGFYLSLKMDTKIKRFKNEMITTELLGSALLPNQRYENPDGSEITIAYDYFGKRRNLKNPTAGPFGKPETGDLVVKVWDK